jgi:redox-sensitive bicupin YhaK (pirin superfamily)
VKINQDAKVYGALLGKGERASLDLQPGRRAWVHVASGAVSLNGEKLGAGDGASLTGERKLALEGAAPAEVLVFDLP